MERIKKYIAITKPGIVRGNVMTGAGGFLLAANGRIDWGLFVAAMAGIALVIASACVTNNYIDREIDKKMARTKKRALVTGTISPLGALVYATILGLLGFGILESQVNSLIVLLGVIAWFSYVVVYGWAKRTTPLGTLVGTVPGAMSLVAGYVAVTGRFDRAAWLLVLIMVAWQMPHFYAIAIYRLKDYKAAGIPVLPAVLGVERTKRSIIGFIVLYAFAALSLFSAGYTGYTYLVGMLAVSLFWLRIGLQGLRTKDDDRWAKKVFGTSLLVLLSFSALIAANAWLP